MNEDQRHNADRTGECRLQSVTILPPLQVVILLSCGFGLSLRQFVFWRKITRVHGIIWR